ncbi:hypothetical protein Zm00014a_004626 [Zea mays]|nr:hypothetical protein Zm00014a_004626 [Zea mays]
MLKSLTI